MVPIISGPDGECDVRHAENQLDGTRLYLGAPEALRQGTDSSDDECFRQTEFYDSGKHEDEQYGHRTGDTRQPDLQARPRYRQQEVAEKAREVVRIPER